MAAYANMDQEVEKDYEEVKQAILHRFDINEETCCQRFRSVRRTGGYRWQKEMQEINRNGNPGAVGSKYATGVAVVDSREEAIISEVG